MYKILVRALVKMSTNYSFNLYVVQGLQNQSGLIDTSL